MDRTRKEPTIFQIVVSLVVSSVLGWMAYNGLDSLIDVMIKKTLHTFWATPTLIVSTIAVFAIIIFVVWLARMLAYKMANAQDEKASDI